MDYVVWAVDGKMKENIGSLKLKGMRAKLMASTMMHRVQDLVVTAENSPRVAHPGGRVVLSGMVR